VNARHNRPHSYQARLHLETVQYRRNLPVQNKLLKPVELHRHLFTLTEVIAVENTLLDAPGVDERRPEVDFFIHQNERGELTSFNAQQLSYIVDLSQPVVSHRESRVRR